MRGKTETYSKDGEERNYLIKKLIKMKQLLREQ